MLDPYKFFRIQIQNYSFNVDPIKWVRILTDFYVTFLSVLRNIYFLDYPAKGWRICRIWRNLRWRSDHKDSNPARSGQDVVLFLRRCPGQRAAKILDFFSKGHLVLLWQKKFFCNFREEKKFFFPISISNQPFTLDSIDYRIYFEILISISWSENNGKDTGYEEKQKF